jgi:hypothetical protein
MARWAPVARGHIAAAVVGAGGKAKLRLRWGTGGTVRRVLPAPIFVDNEATKLAMAREQAGSGSAAMITLPAT